MGLRYEVIADDIRRLISEGGLSAGTRLPSEAALSAHYRVSVPTLRQALGLLQAEGLIEKRHGSGNYVRTPRPLVEYSNARLWATTCEPETSADEEIEVSVALSQSVTRAEVRSRLNVPARKRLLEYTYRSRFLPDGAPYALTRSYLIREMLPGRPEIPAPASAWGDDFRYMLADAGIELAGVTERLMARPPRPEESIALGIPRGVAVLALERTSIDTHGVVVEVADTVMAGDRVKAVYTTLVANPHAAEGKPAGYGGGEPAETEEPVIRERVVPVSRGRGTR